MAQMASSAISNLPDSAFAYIESGGHKDSENKTVPRSLRHFPIHDAAHVRNALARAPQSPFGRQAMPKIVAAAKRFGITVNADRSAGDVMSNEDAVERRFVGANQIAAYTTQAVVEVRDGERGKHIAGYGSVFDKSSRNLGGFVEEIQHGAFNRSFTEGFPNVVARYNHDPNMLLGTTNGKTLSLRIDNVGLWYEVLPPQSRADILELVQRGDVRHSSFAFRVRPDGEEWTITEQNYPLRRVHDVELVDVAPVVNPAYPEATAGLRSLARHFDANYEEVRAMADRDELRKFFVKTGGNTPPPGKPVTPPKFGPSAMMDLMARRRDPSES